MLTAIRKRTARGHVRVGDDLHPYTARRATGDAGLFRLERTLRGEEFVGGWIRLGDGSVRGSVDNKTKDTTADPGTAQEVVGGEGGGGGDVGSSVPPSATTPIPVKGSGKSFQCRSDVLFANDLVSRINKGGGWSKATKAQQSAWYSIAQAVIDHCPTGTLVEDVGDINP